MPDSFGSDPLSGLTAPPVEGPSAAFADRLRRRVAAIEARSTQPSRTDGESGWHLAQLNLGLFRAPLDAPEMAPFANALDRINELAEQSPGFVWRLIADDGGSSSFVEVPGADDPLLASNLSVWTDVESLWNFMYRTDHAAYLRRRSEWFRRERQPMTVAWWIPASEVPTLDEAMRRLEMLRENGPSDDAFPLGRKISPPPTTAPSTSDRMSSQPSSRTSSRTSSQRPSERATGTQVLIPYLTVSDARAALLFYAEVFGAERSGELFEMDDGRIGHAEMTIDGQTFYLADEFAEMGLQAPVTQGSNSVSIVIGVADCDAVYEHALLAGASGERPPSNQHGRRSAWFVDPWGHRWSPTSPSTADSR